ncbi:MAG: phosphotransferase [Defluviitaleaceae bacterium]|nr:phosphotransferase [Defluviitaleaceae bacterium]
MDKILSKFNIPEYQGISLIANNGAVKNVSNNEAVRNVGDKYILKKTAHIDQCKRNISLAQQLSEKGILVPRFIPLKNGDFYTQEGDYYYSLMTKLNGKAAQIDTGDYIKKAEIIGKLVASLTLAFSNCECDVCPDTNCIHLLNDWVKREIADKSLPVSKRVLEYLDNFETLYRKLPRQINHKDLNGGNMLFDDNMVFQGFIDFDIAEIDARAYDISYILWCIIYVDEKDNPKKFHRSIEIAKCVFENYSSIVKLTADEKRAIPYLYIYIGIMVSAWISKSGNVDLAVSCAKCMEMFFDNLHYITFS